MGRTSTKRRDPSQTLSTRLLSRCVPSLESGSCPCNVYLPELSTCGRSQVSKRSSQLKQFPTRNACVHNLLWVTLEQHQCLSIRFCSVKCEDKMCVSRKRVSMGILCLNRAQHRFFQGPFAACRKKIRRVDFLAYLDSKKLYFSTPTVLPQAHIAFGSSVRQRTR